MDLSPATVSVPPKRCAGWLCQLSRSIRLDNFTQIRAIVDEELEAVWAGQKPPHETLDAIVTRGNHELQKFQQAHPHILAQ